MDHDHDIETGGDGGSGKMKLYAILGSVGLLLVLALLIWGLFSLGGADQSALERFRDIAVIFIVLLAMIIVVLLAGITAALAFVAFQLKDRIIPLLEEITGTVKQVRGTTAFMTEEAIKPVVSIAGNLARWRAMARTASGRKR